MATAFTNNPDSSELQRFPLNYGSYFLVRLAYGAFDPSTALGSLWSLGILVGVGLVRPRLPPWALLVLLAFAAFNLLFMQMIFAWLERWLAQRRTREIMGILFFLLLLSVQLIGPLTGHFEKRPRPEVRRFVELVGPVQNILPPGLRRRRHRERRLFAVPGGLQVVGAAMRFRVGGWVLPTPAVAGAISR